MMRPNRSLSTCLLLLLTVGISPAQNIQHGLRVPPGFEVTEFADSKLANDIYRLTIDPRGRVVVSGRGYIRILADDDNDGRADRAIDFADGPKDGAMGLLWEDRWLYFTGDGGLRRYRVTDSGDRADGPSELIRAMRTGGEHHAHDIRRGPDGWLYVLCGNNTGIDKSFAQLATSPIKEPVAGCVLRFTPDLKSSEIVADGFRNAYGMDFNLDGELFTYDSDNERCVSLPWYEPTRFYHVIPGGHHGWQAPQRAQWWRIPPYFPDVVAPIVYLERGSPTGIACYRHTQFPELYHGGIFALDWTFGRVWFLPLKRSGSTYTTERQLFIEAVGDNGFAPTDIVVHPATGDLFISIGGRGTRGAVYRIRYPKGLKTAATAARPIPPCSLAWQPDLIKALPEKASAADALERLRALTAIRRHRPHFNAGQLLSVIRANWDHPDRYVRKATANLIASLSKEERRSLGQEKMAPLQLLTYCLGIYREEPDEVLRRIGSLPGDANLDPDWRRDAVRLVQLALGDVMSARAKGTIWEGYTPRQPEQVRAGAQVLAELREVFPTEHAELDIEVSRTLAMGEVDAPGLPEKVAARLIVQGENTSDPVRDIHYLTVLARLPGPHSAEVTRRVADALIALDEKIRERRLNRDTNWPLRIAELHAELARKEPGLNVALLAHPQFGRPDHALFARCPGFDQCRAAEVFLARAAGDEEYPWTPALVELVGTLPEEKCLPVLRRLWDRGGLEESILPVLARRPDPADREKFLEGLNSPQLATIRLCLEALAKLPRRNDGLYALALVRALRRLSDSREENPLREQIAAHLERLTGRALGTNPQAWTDWFTKTYPELAARLGGTDGVDIEGWNRRLAKLDWSAGDAERGRGVYTRAGCASCHSGAQALGPDLRGVAGRFSRDDLFTAILQPSRDISPRYRTTLVATADGKVYQGSVIYQAADSLILQTGPAATVRITDSQIVARRYTDTSLMPAGLLDKLSDRDIADLYAYLRSLGNPSANPRRRKPRNG
ncbi:MAG TPA: hypothetical protein VNK04_23205 [Gemmataceae bacterium]|nr:hypothetical protein [Gemmataceae bacterium]